MCAQSINGSLPLQLTLSCVADLHSNVWCSFVTNQAGMVHYDITHLLVFKDFLFLISKWLAVSTKTVIARFEAHFEWWTTIDGGIRWTVGQLDLISSSQTQRSTSTCIGSPKEWTWDTKGQMYTSFYVIVSQERFSSSHLIYSIRRSCGLFTRNQNQQLTVVHVQWLSGVFSLLTLCSCETGLDPTWAYWIIHKCKYGF